MLTSILPIPLRVGCYPREGEEGLASLCSAEEATRARMPSEPRGQGTSSSPRPPVQTGEAQSAPPLIS